MPRLSVLILVLAVRDGRTDVPAAHQTMRDFYLDKYEVTNARWNVFEAVGRPIPASGAGAHTNADGTLNLFSGWNTAWNNLPLADTQGRAGVGPGNQPVAWVTWYGAFAFCAFSDGYLPYEGE
jgi:sulfatase modifying factor 1